MLEYVRGYVWRYIDLHTFCSTLHSSAALHPCGSTSAWPAPQAAVPLLKLLLTVCPLWISVNLCELVLFWSKHWISAQVTRLFSKVFSLTFSASKMSRSCWHESIAEIFSAHWTVLTSFITLQLGAPFGLPCQSLCVRPWRKDMF